MKEEDRAYYEEQIANLEQDKQKKITEQRDLYDNTSALLKNIPRNYWMESAT